MRRRLFLSGLLGVSASGRLRAAEPDDGLVRAWIARSGAVKSVAAEFRQERYLRALPRPLVSHGKVWYRADGAWRMQLGDPPAMIVLRTAAGAGVQVIAPGARTVQVVAADEAGLKGEALALLDAGFPRSYEEFEKRFRLQAVETVAAGGWRVTTQLRDSGLALAVQRMVFVLDEAGARLCSLEVWLRDGSRVENYFTLLEENVTVPDSLFREATDGFREVK